MRGGRKLGRVGRMERLRRENEGARAQMRRPSAFAVRSGVRGVWDGDGDLRVEPGVVALDPVVGVQRGKESEADTLMHQRLRKRLLQRRRDRILRAASQRR